MTSRNLRKSIIKNAEDEKTFNEFVMNNKGDITWLGADVLMSVSPVLYKVFKSFKNPYSARLLFDITFYAKNNKFSRETIELISSYANKLNIRDKKGIEEFVKYLGKGNFNARMTRVKEIIRKGHRRVNPNKLDSLLKGFQPQSFQVGDKSVDLLKGDFKHLMERHHPDYWNGSMEKTQSFFADRPKTEEMKGMMEEIIQKNQDKILKRGFYTNDDSIKMIASIRKEFLETGIRRPPPVNHAKIVDKIDGKYYTLTVRNGRVVQFHPGQ